MKGKSERRVGRRGIDSAAVFLTYSVPTSQLLMTKEPALTEGGATSDT